MIRTGVQPRGGCDLKFRRQIRNSMNDGVQPRSGMILQCNLTKESPQRHELAARTLFLEIYAWVGDTADVSGDDSIGKHVPARNTNPYSAAEPFSQVQFTRNPR